jgi:ssDNA-binding Zn-finger/Zn-ribbon topoisomerase 1
MSTDKHGNSEECSERLREVKEYLTCVSNGCQKDEPLPPNLTCPVCGKPMRQRGVIEGLMMGPQNSVSIIYTCKEHQDIVVITTITKMDEEAKISGEHLRSREVMMVRPPITYIY